jgi:DNA-binding NtrC family response regulator
VRGVLYLDTQAAERAFSAEDLDFATALGVHAALVLDRVEEQARTAEALARSDERLELMQSELLRHEIVGRSPALLQAYDALRRFARAGARVLLRGETGTGKELFARAYAAESGRPARGFVPVPIPALAPTLVESELFGHVRGAFTEAARDKKGRLEMADQGVLFLDEIGDVDPALQTKLLRFLDSGELVRVGDTAARRVDALVVSATNRPLEKDVESGRFRSDLLARLGHVVAIPPLRERPEDIPLLVEHVLSRIDRGPERHRFVPETLDRLQRHHWPFNVRELQQVVERAVCLVDAEEVRPEHLPEYLRREAPGSPSSSGPPRPLREVVEAAEKAHVLRTLEHTGGNRRRAIELLGIAPETFYRRLEAWGLHRRDDERD